MIKPRQITPHGALLFSITRSLRLAMLWVLIFALPVWVMMGFYSENHNIHLVFFSLLLLSPAIYLFLVKFTDKINIYERQIEFQSLFGKKTIPLNRHTKIYIEQIMNRMYGVSVAKHARIRLVNGTQRLKIPSGFNDLDSVMGYLHNFQQNVILPKIIDDFNQNKTIDFDVIQIKKNGMIFKKKIYRWEEISRIELANGVLKLYGQQSRLLGGADVYTEVKNIANFATCQYMLSQALSVSYA